jgi:hypothetical protein
MMSKIVIFTGPSLSPAEACLHLDAIFLPPAKQGDVYAAYLKYKPAIIGMIDGHFENVPAPWHKEILWVMAQGVKVYGASSMGALRAAELHCFGMIGVGKIFELFRDNVLEDDDEVAVVHGPEALNYPSLSEAMVNIRETLEAAKVEGVISDTAFWAAVASAKTLFYRDRNYNAVLTGLRAIDGLQDDADRLATWLPDHKINLKKQDALRLLHEIRDSQDTKPNTVQYQFQDTQFWRTMKQQIEEGMA